MKVVYGIENLSHRLKKPILTIGVFDGVHIGHQHIIKKVVNIAKARRDTSVVLTFDPHPLRLLKPEEAPPFLTSLQHRLRLIAQLGIELCLVLNFDARLAGSSPEKFIKNILVERIGASEVLVADNFVFGKDRSGDVPRLQALGSKYSLLVKGFEPIKFDGQPISSSRIRTLIERGQLRDAAKLLGRPVTILGTVVEGDARGKLLGFPTANVNPHHEAIPPSGVYAVAIKFDNSNYGGILNIGTRPTFYGIHKEDKEPSIEVHIFDFSKRIYGRDIEVSFVKKLRGEMKFPDKEKLIRQIRKDEKKAKRILRGF